MPNYTEELRGFTLKPDRKRVEILFILRVLREGHWFWPKTKVTYSYKGDTKTLTVDNGLAICAPSTAACESNEFSGKGDG